MTYTVNGKILLTKYALDYSPMKDFYGNITLSELSDGPHKIFISIDAENGYTSNITSLISTQPELRMAQLLTKQAL